MPTERRRLDHLPRPGARNEAQARSNAQAAELAPPTPDTMAQLVRTSAEDVRAQIHHRW